MSSGLNNQQKLFVECYLKHFNATRAAKEAGYSEKTAYSQGHDLLKKPEIQSRVRARLDEAAMSANEVLYHLTQIARGDLNDLVDDNGNLDLKKAREEGKTNLLKRIKSRNITTENSDIYEAETEGYDRLRALELLGKHHALFTDKMKIEDWRSDAIAIIKSGQVSYEEMVERFDDSLARELFMLAEVPIS